jgi:hypothetical protein
MVTVVETFMNPLSRTQERRYAELADQQIPD